jgi:hypothetical protein
MKLPGVRVEGIDVMIATLAEPKRAVHVGHAFDCLTGRQGSSIDSSIRLMKTYPGGIILPAFPFEVYFERHRRPRAV